MLKPFLIFLTMSGDCSTFLERFPRLSHFAPISCLHAFNTVKNIYVCLFVDKWLNLCKQTLFHLAGGNLKPFSSISFGFITGFFFSLIKYQNCDFPYSWRYDRLGSVVKVHYGSFKQQFFCMAYCSSDSTLWCRPR